MSTFSSSFVLCSENEDSTMELSSTSSPRASEPPNNDYDYTEVPPEVWKEILHKIEDPLTFQNCSKVSSEFCEILRTERASQLFPLVLPFINDQLLLKDLLSCRQACKRWKNGVDNHLPLDPSWNIRSKHAFRIDPETVRYVFPLGNVFYKIEQLNSFISSMESCTGNPFPTRTVLLYNLATPDANRNGVRLEVQDEEELFTAFRSLLRKFGDQIHTFVFVTDHNDHLQACIQQIIKLLPNLKKLRLEVLNNDPWGLQVFNEGWDWFKHLNSFLISLHVGPFYSSKVTGSILEAIGSQLEYLGCEATTIQELIYFGSPTHPWFIREIPNLRELNITRIDMSRSDNELLILQRLARLRLPKLEKLFYDADQNAMEGEISLKTVLQLINQFASTLEELKLTMPLQRMIRNEVFGVEDPEAVALLGVPVPKLKTLGIGYTMISHPLLEQVLDKFTNLEKVRLHEYKINLRRDLQREGENEEVVVPFNVRQKILLLDDLVKSEKFKSIELWANNYDKAHIYTFKRT